MKKTIKVEKLGDITEKQLMEIENAKRHDIVIDKDSPEITEEMMEQFRRVAKDKREERLRLFLQFGEMGYQVILDTLIPLKGTLSLCGCTQLWNILEKHTVKGRIL